jgi:hypothetical protein
MISDTDSSPLLSSTSKIATPKKRLSEVASWFVKLSQNVVILQSPSVIPAMLSSSLAALPVQGCGAWKISSRLRRVQGM